jgi:hypothetical protein
MENYDSNMIKPVNSLQIITGMAPARRREQRRRRQQFNSEKKEKDWKQNNEEAGKNKPDDVLSNDDADGSKIDYRA